MKLKNIFWALALVLVGVFLAFTSVKSNIKKEVNPKMLHYSIVDNTRYVEVEEVATLIISGDPTLMLIDVRSEKEFNKFSLSNAINIPLDSMLIESNKDYLLQDVYNVVLYSNGTTSADQAWILAKRLGATNNFVMKGGLNLWVENILHPVNDNNLYDRVEDEKYQYRKGASQYFGGGSSTPIVSGDNKSKPKTKPIKRKKKEVEGGCG